MDQLAAQGMSETAAIAESSYKTEWIGHVYLMCGLFS